nr:aldehyde dehydrogenase family protein [Pseudomonadales bacterium]
GAIISATQLKRIQSLVAQGAAEGAEVWQAACDMPQNGCFYPPTLLTGVEPAATVAQEEIFGPVLVAMVFRTPAEAIELANNTRYGLAANIWTENINEAMHVAAQLKAGTVWINSANNFDASVGFGGYRESGFGREGGPEGLTEYLQRNPRGSDRPFEQRQSRKRLPPLSSGIDRTPKQYIGGKQARPDSGYSMPVEDAAGRVIAELPKGNRKDVRNAVEAARAASGWSAMTGHQRAQVLYFLAENLTYRKQEFIHLLVCLSGRSQSSAEAEFEEALSRIFTCAAYADKFEGTVHLPDKNRVALAMKEALGVIAVAAPEESPLLGLISTVLAAVAMGNRIVLVPSETYCLIATNLYQVLDTSDVPGGVINIVCGPRHELIPTLAGHGDVDGFWCWDSSEVCAEVELLAAENMKRTWLSHGSYLDWHDEASASGGEFLERSVEVKNIWVPYGV